MKTTACLSHLLALLAALAACESTPPAAAEAMTLDEFIAKYREKECVTMAACSGWSAVARCKTYHAPGDKEVIAEVAAKKLKFDGAKAKACLDALSCDNDSPIVCEEVFPGSVPTGGDCSKADCAPGNMCVTTEGCSRCKARGGLGAVCDWSYDCNSRNCMEGKCSTAPTKSGDACSADCPNGLVCLENKCTTRLKAGAACNHAGQCEAGMACWKSADATATEEAKCTPAAKVDGDCTKTDCAFYDSSCLDASAGKKTCKANGLRGEACAEGTAPCFQTLWCNPATKLCEQAKEVAAGGKCEGGGNCAAGLWCDTGATPNVCTPPKADGSACLNDGECKSNYCDKPTGKCAVPKCG